MILLNIYKLQNISVLHIFSLLWHFDEKLFFESQTILSEDVEHYVNKGPLSFIYYEIPIVLLGI